MGVTGSAFSWTYLGVYSGCCVEVRFSPHQLFTQVPQGSMLGAIALCHIHNLAGTDHPVTWFFIPLLCRWHPATPVVSLNDPSVPDNISNCLSDISAWMQDHLLQLNVGEAELIGKILTSTLTACLLPRLFEILDSWLIINWLFLIIYPMSPGAAWPYSMLEKSWWHPPAGTSHSDVPHSLTAMSVVKLLQAHLAHMVFNQPNWTHVTPLQIEVPL